MDMTIKEKVKEIEKAINSGVPKRRIGVGGNGATVRKLLRGENMPDEKIEEMYANLQAYRKNPNEDKGRKEKYRNSHPEVLKKKKVEAIIKAAESGAVKDKLDPCGGGDAVRKLQQGKSVGTAKINEVYANLLEMESGDCTKNTREKTPKVSVSQKKGKAQRKPASKEQKPRRSRSPQIKGKANKPSAKEKENKTKARKDVGQKESSPQRDNAVCKKVEQQEKQIAELTAKVTILEDTVREITEFMGSNKKRPIKVLGITVTQKTDKVGDRQYRRWYGIYRGVDGKDKPRWIYIGKDVTCAEEKIRAWLEKNERKQNHE